MLPLRRFLHVAVVALGLAAAALVVLVFQHQTRIEFETHYFNSWALHKGTNELNQFLQRLSLYARGEGDITADEVALRLDILVNRIATLSTGNLGAFMDADDQRATTLREFAAAVREVEKLSPRFADPATAADVISLLIPFDSRLSQIAAETYVADSVRNSEHWVGLHRLRWHFLVVACCLVLAAGMLAWKTLRQQRSILDANERLRALAARSVDSAAEFHDAIASLSDGLILWDAQNRVATWNRRCEEILPYARTVLRQGLTFAEYVRQSVAINHPHWTDAAREQRIAERLSQHRRRAGTGEFTTLDRRIIEVRENPTSNGGCVSVFRDITAERRLLSRLTISEAELQRALAAEREINAQQRQFVSMASHEFKTPLAIIDSASQRLMSRPDLAASPDVAKRVDRIRSSVARMIQIIDRTLSTAQLDESRVGLQLEACDLRRILHDVCERQRGIAQRFTIRLDLPPDDVPLTADPRLLDQVFTNLVANAVKYSGVSTLVEVAVVTDDESVTVAVRDHGLGIPENEIGRLFTRFYRASTTLTIPGTGIGLHLVKQFVSLHGGSIAVTSEVQKGSTFTVRLPRAQPLAAPRRAVA